MPPIGVDTIIALERVKAAFGDAHTDVPLRVYSQPCHSGGVCTHMGLADQYRPTP